MEIQPGPFAFIVDLPWTVSAEDAEAKLEAGMLVIRLGKRNGGGGTIQISTGSGSQLSSSENDKENNKEIAGGENDQ